MHALVSEDQLREYESEYLTGKYTTVTDLEKVLSNAVRTLRDVVAHGQGEWAAVIPTKDARRLIVSAVRVPGRQTRLPLYDDLRDATRAEAALSLAAATRATEIMVKAREHAMYIEEYREELDNSPDRNLTQKLVRAIRPGASQIVIDGTSFPAMNGTALPKTLPSSRVHKLRVTVVSVNDAHCVAHVSVQRVLQGDATLESVRALLPVKCPDANSRKYLVAVQAADEILEIHVGGEFPTTGGAGNYDLHLLDLVADCSAAQMFQRAANKMKEAEQLSLISDGTSEQ